MRPFQALLLLICAAATAASAALCWPEPSRRQLPVAPTPAAAAAAAAATVALPRFVPNVGQWSDEVAFGVIGDAVGWLHRDGFTLQVERRSPRAGDRPAEQVGCIVRTRFAGAGAVEVSAGERLPGVYHFLRGSDPSGWHHDVPAHATARLCEVQPGIDVVFRALPAGVAGPFEYDLLLAPGADLGAFAARCEGIDSLRIAADGSLRLQVSLPDEVVELVQQPPIAWQDGPDGRRPVRVAFRRIGADGYGFSAPDLDSALATTVDPGVVWSTYLGGGASDSVNDLVWRPGQGLWLGGWAGSLDFPTTPGAYRTTGRQDGFLARLDENGTNLVYGTYLGGSLGDEVRSLELGPGLQPTVVGFTRSLDFPVTPGAYQANYAGASLVVDVGDAFVTHLDAAGAALVGSTYLGGMFDEVAEGVVVDAAGNACVAGWTSSPNLPTTPGAWQPGLNGPVTLQTDGFVARIAANGTAAIYCTYVGGSLPDQLLDIALVPGGNDVVVGGWSVSPNYPTTGTAYRTSNSGSLEMVVTRLNATGSGPVFSTYLGGIREDLVNAVAVASDSSVWLGGVSDSANFPTSVNAPQPAHGGGDDGVLCHLNASGSALLFSTRFGGPGDDSVRGVAIDGGNVMVVGQTTGGIPVTAGAEQPTFGGGSLDGFAAYYTGGGAVLDYASYFGGTHDEVLDSVVLANSGLAMLGGWSFSSDFPVTSGTFQTQRRGVEDGVVVNFDLLSNLGDGLSLTGAGAEGSVSFVGEGEHDALVVVATNRSLRELQIEAVRVLIAGKGAAPALVTQVRLLADSGEAPETARLVAGPVAVVADDEELLLSMRDVRIPVGGSVTLRLVVDLAAGSAPGTVELACAIVDGNAWTVRAAGAGAGPTVRVLGTGRVDGTVLVVGNLPGDVDGDGDRTVFDVRKLCSRVGTDATLFDTDGDGVVTRGDALLTSRLVLGLPAVLSCPTVLQRGQWFTVQGAFPVGKVVEAVLGGRSPTLGTVTPREVTLRVGGDQQVGVQELRIVVDGLDGFVATVQVQ